MRHHRCGRDYTSFTDIDPRKNDSSRPDPNVVFEGDFPKGGPKVLPSMIVLRRPEHDFRADIYAIVNFKPPSAIETYPAADRNPAADFYSPGRSKLSPAVYDAADPKREAKSSERPTPQVLRWYPCCKIDA
jgi:hypothetical protein